LFHKLINVLKEMPQTVQAKQQMIDKCKHYYQTNNSELNRIQQFEETYQSSDAIRWYTEESFLYKLLNKALRIEDVSLLYIFRFYIIDLCKQIEHESKRYLSLSPQSHYLKLYRGQVMSKQEINKLKKHIGHFISPNGFFSTSEDFEVALMFAGDDESKSALFEISIDRTITKSRSVIFAAAIERYSCFPDEKEVVFSLGTTFKLNGMFYDSQFKKLRIQMTATDKGLEYIQTHIDLMKENLEETTSAALFGEILIDMGQYSKAESYHRLVINTLPKSHDDIPSLYHGLGYIYYKRRQYNQALKYGGIAHNILKQTLPSNHLHIAQSCVNLGWDHKRNGYPNRALKLFKKALSIREMNYCDKDHINIAIALISIGDTYTDLDDYQNAFDYLIRGLEMFQRILPCENFEISKTLMKIGNLFEKQSLSDHAMEYYQRGYNMAKKVMPIEHPRIITYFKRIMRLYKKMNNINEAIQFSDENLVLQCELLGEIHRNIAEIHLVTADVINDIEQKLSKYYKVLHILGNCFPIDEEAIAVCRSKIDDQMLV
jgi:tetratricopeptide (TPR) repeat protein